MNNDQIRIHVAVACHKPSKLPNNKYLVPVQVNSAAASKRLDMAHDDEGINISRKNSSYCELTAQYWEWKNVDADYYGLCHYRRLFSFLKPEGARTNERNQYEAEVIDDWNLKRFGLEDEELMLREVSGWDVITGTEQNISKLYTPRGNQITAIKHWKAHDRALIMNEDLEKMLRILCEVSPELGKSTKEYLNGKTFTGFNCFIMKKELFNEMCEIEFEVLERLEKETDLSHYCTQISRIYGFMGEIISSSYINYLSKKGKKVKHVPLVYFNNTDEEQVIKPIDKEAIPIVFYHTDDRAELFASTWQSFLSYQNPQQKYDAIICCTDIKKSFEKTLSKMASGYENVSLRFIDGDLISKRIVERYGAEKLERNYKKNAVPILPFLLDSLKGFDEVLLIGNRTLLQIAPDSLWNENIESEKVFAAPLDPLMLARVNDIYTETELNNLINQVRDVWDYHSITAMKVDLKEYRRRLDRDKLLEISVDKNGKFRKDARIINMLFDGLFQTIDQKWCVWYDSNSYLAYQLPYAPKGIYQDLLKARHNPYVVTYMKKDPFNEEYTELSERYWEEARKTPCYEAFVSHLVKINSSGLKKSVKNALKWRMKKMTFLTRLVPGGSKMYFALKKKFNYNDI